MLNLNTTETIYISVGSKNDLVQRRGIHKFKDMDRIVKNNLTTNEPYCKTLHYEIKPLSASTLASKCRLLLKVHAKQNPRIYTEAILSIFIMTGVIAITIIGSRVLSSHIVTSSYFTKLYDDIIHERLKYVSSGRLVGLERYYEDVFTILGTYFFIMALPVLGTIRYSFDTVTNLKKSFLEFFNDPHVLIRQEESKDSSYPLNDEDELANSYDDFFVQDPILMSDIKKEWMHAPRFIKIGKILYSLDTALQFLFQNPLENGSIKSLTGNWSLTTEDQEKLITDLSQLFMIEKDDILKYWDPYFCDWDKVLSGNCPNWIDLNQQQKASVKQQIRNDLFANLRLLNFLKEFDEAVLNTSIKLNDNEDGSFTLKDLQTELQNKPYQIRV